jgi:hypothetical protein
VADIKVGRTVVRLCAGSGGCPAAYELEGDDILIQGYAIGENDQVTIQNGMTGVLVPATLLREAANQLG